MPGPDSLVIELQRVASDNSASVTDLLRKALIVATKLKIEDFKEWVQAELKGYGSSKLSVPEYRRIRCNVMVRNPRRGGMIPMVFQSEEQAQHWSQSGVSNPIAECEELMGMKEGELVISYSADEERRLIDDDERDRGMIPIRVLPANRLIGVVSAVRTTVLEWALKLEQEGILGEGMTFSESEKKKAAESMEVHIGSFQGVFGNVNATNFQVGDYGSIHAQLKDAGVSQAERNELENILDELRKAKPEDKPGIVQRGMDWLGRNAENIGALGNVVKKWLE